ncbi:energy-coupling factor transporter ATPase [Evansella tamaricis]|uniref:Energy-coupling factor transporter ATPase n=1 Tax=Evansella tamaricis TaxID=2069301 RepID=A0ABS6JAR8_9BACI|nr:energy-coupling factor transporter ATPase [Evansella tamaricis]
MNKDIVRIHNLSFQYRPNEPYVLTDINLTIKEREWITIVGHNGSGKSSLAKFLNALFIPDEDGEVYIYGLNTKERQNQGKVRKLVAMVFQNPDNQLVAPTVEDDVAFGLENTGVPREEMIERVKESIKIMGLEGFEKQEPHRLSGGQKQRVAIAGVIAMKPKVVVLDEATSMLDPVGRKEVMEYIRRVHNDVNMTVIMITHDLNEALFSDRIIVMKEGKILKDAPPIEVLRDEELLKKSLLKPTFEFEVQSKLKEKGINLFEISPQITNQKELVDALCTWKQKM